ncbi:MAG: endonuclease/exonuclease/phosphatase family protein [Bacteroidota bacterium]|nr:endonuclease/exonuclease/phosphatase family protein [Bacteroidota bacterium]
MNIRISLTLLVFLTASLVLPAQNKQVAVYSIGFYNLENLFDTIASPGVNDLEFTPNGAKKWNGQKYWKKIDNMSYAISKIARDYCPEGPALLGVSEVENRSVLEDLTKSASLRSVGYQIVHYDSPEARGVDVALLYNPSLFTLTSSKPYRFTLPGRPDWKSRDQLLVNGLLAGEPIHILVCHWPSRRSGEKSSRYLRIAAANLSKHIIDSLLTAEPKAKIVLMGDLNDDPYNESVKTVLNAKKRIEDVAPGGLYNTMWKWIDKGIGSLGYRGEWNLFDQIIISQGWLGSDRNTLKFWKSEVFNKDFLVQQDGPYKGYPWRTFSGDTFIEGYSDHFPTLIYLIKEAR